MGHSKMTSGPIQRGQIIPSRRPGMVCQVVEIDIPLLERQVSNARVARMQELWDMMREEARTADMELADKAARHG